MRGSLRNTRGSRVAGSPFHVPTFRLSILPPPANLFRNYSTPSFARKQWSYRAKIWGMMPSSRVDKSGSHVTHGSASSCGSAAAGWPRSSSSRTCVDDKYLSDGRECDCKMWLYCRPSPLMQVSFLHTEMCMCMCIAQKFCRNRYHSRFSYYRRKATMGLNVYHYPKNGSVLDLWEPRMKIFL